MQSRRVASRGVRRLIAPVLGALLAIALCLYLYMGIAVGANSSGWTPFLVGLVALDLVGGLFLVAVAIRIAQRRR